jgi:hypothetical protein
VSAAVSTGCPAALVGAAQGDRGRRREHDSLRQEPCPVPVTILHRVRSSKTL